MKNKTRLIKYLIFLINILGVLYVIFTIQMVTTRMIQFNQTRDFLDDVAAIPKSPGSIIIWSVGLLIGLLGNLILREYRFKNNQKVVFTTLAIDLMLTILLMWVLNFNYNGLLFWVVANVIYYVEDVSRYFFMSLAIISYAVTDFQFISLNFKLFSIKSYFAYFPSHPQQFMLVIYNLLSSCNIIVFIVFCVFVIQQQRGVIEEVNMLYSKLRGVNEELKNANHGLHELADVKEKMGQTKERNRLAREIHDTLGHTLTGISAGLDACIAMVDVSGERTKEQLKVLAKVTRDGIGDVRRSVSELRPDSLERLALDRAIDEMLESIRSITEAKVDFTCNADLKVFDEDEANTIFRIVQESITNAIRHGKASHIVVTICREDDNIRLNISDNGIGCTDMKKGFGTKHMMERVQLLNGRIRFDGANGFTVDAKIPIRWGTKND